MRFAFFFIDRPVFAAVLSIVTVIVGAISIVALPIAQYPDIAPPTVTVSCAYPGANAKTVAETVATPIEQQVNGVEGMLYMSSQSTNDGSMILTVTFKLGTDLDIAQVQVQNRVAIAQPLLPFDVQRAGIVVKKASPNITLGIAVYSPDKSRDPLYVSNFVTLQVKDELARLPGVGDLTIFGSRDYSMRLWLNPEKIVGPGYDRRRCDCRGAGAESAGGGRHCRRRSTSARDGAVSVHHQCARSIDRAESIRRHCRQDRRRRQRDQAERCRARGAGSCRLYDEYPLQRPAGSGNWCFPTARVELDCHGERGLQKAGGAKGKISSRRRLCDSVRHDDVRSRQHSTTL